MEEDHQLTENFTDAIRDQNFHNFKQLTKNASSEWWRKTNYYGHTLLQEATRHNSKEIFDYILRQDALDLETEDISGKTALMFVLDEIPDEPMEYYACELINKGAFIHTIRTIDGKSFLHQAVKEPSMKVTKLLLEKGIDVNLQDYIGWTALHEVLSKGPQTDTYEFVTTLLCYGADPFIETDCFERYNNAFGFSILFNHTVPIQEILFLYTFDEYTRCIVHLDVLLELARLKSPFFQQICEYDVEILSSQYLRDFCNLFVIIDVDPLRILLKKCKSVITEIITNINNDSQHEGKLFRMCSEWHDSVNSDHFLTNLNFLLEYNETMKADIVNVLRNLHSSLFHDYYFFGWRNESETAEPLMYMFSYGLQCGSNICDSVYRLHGYCQLFKFLLCLDIDQTDLREHPNGMAPLIYDITLDLETYLKKNTLCGTGAYQLLPYFAHSKLSDLLIKTPKENNFSGRIEKFENPPRMPLLVELSRNVFRKYFVQRLNIKSC